MPKLNITALDQISSSLRDDTKTIVVRVSDVAHRSRVAISIVGLNAVPLSNQSDNILERKPDGLYARIDTTEDVDFLASYILASN